MPGDLFVFVGRLVSDPYPGHDIDPSLAARAYGALVNLNFALALVLATGGLDSRRLIGGEGIAQALDDRLGGLADMLGEQRAADGGDGIKATGTFHDTLVSNVTELADILPGLNLAQDPALDAMARRLREDLASVDADTLRADPIVRADTAAAADAILRHVSDYLA